MTDKPEGTPSRENAEASKNEQPESPAMLQTKDTGHKARKYKQEGENTADPEVETVKSPRILPWIKRKAGEAHLTDWFMVFFTLIIAGATIAYTIYARRQWSVMNDQLTAMEGQLTQMKVANEQTKLALHISERAYLVVATPLLNITNGVVTLQVDNDGRISSGATVVTDHEVTVEQTNTFIPPDIVSHAVERHWKQFSVLSVSPGSDVLEIAIPLPAFSKERLKLGSQAVVIAGSITYNDGFPDDTTQTFLFCWQSVRQLIVKKTFWAPCEAPRVIPTMKKLDGYPQNEQRN